MGVAWRGCPTCSNIEVSARADIIYFLRGGLKVLKPVIRKQIPNLEIFGMCQRNGKGEFLGCFLVRARDIGLCILQRVSYTKINGLLWMYIFCFLISKMH